MRPASKSSLDPVQEGVSRGSAALDPAREAVATGSPVVGRNVDRLWRATFDHVSLDAAALQRAVGQPRGDPRPDPLGGRCFERILEIGPSRADGRRTPSAEPYRSPRRVRRGVREAAGVLSRRARTSAAESAADARASNLTCGSSSASSRSGDTLKQAIEEMGS
jgi:hypothetical protein